MRAHILRSNVLNAEVIVYSGCSRKEALKDMKDNLKGEHVKAFIKSLKGADGAEGYCTSVHANVFIWVENDITTPKGVGVLAHEALHAAISIMQVLGITVTDQTEEIMAYFIQFIVTEVLADVRTND